MLGLQIISLIVLIILSAFFSGVEVALVSLNKVKVRSLVKRKKKGARALHRIKQNPHKLIITILIGNNLVNIGAAAIATVLFTNLFGSSGIGIATGVMTFLILVFGEITPKTFAAQNAEKVSLKVARSIEALSAILYPLVVFFEAISRVMLTFFGSKDKGKFSEEELRTIITIGREQGIISREAADMIHNVIEFERTKITKIMTPKARIEMINGKSKLKDVLDFVVKTPYSKHPVYWGNKNEIVGVLDVDDVLRHVRDKRLNVQVKKIAGPIFFIPETKEIDDLLAEFDNNNLPMAIVVDEFGDVSGLITVEDVLEEIVGDIFDKEERHSVYVKKVNKKLIQADARATVEEINKVIHLGLSEKEFDTIAGFIIHTLQKIPKKGEKIKLKHVTIEVDKVTKQGIKSVKIYKN